MIPALVLTAGLATRLRPLSAVRAKAALPVAGTPLVQRIVTWLMTSGVTDLVLNLHHLPHTITSVMGDGSHLGARIRYSWETPVLGSAGGPRRAAPLLDRSPFLIVNGDTLTDVDVKAMVVAHRDSGAMVTMALVPNPEPEKYSGVGLHPDGAFARWVPRGEETPSYHFVGVQVAQADAFASISDRTPSEVRTLYSTLAESKPGSVRGFVTEAEFFDIGTPADYLRTSLAIATRERTGSVHGHRTHVGETASVSGSILWDDVTVGEGAHLDHCIVTDGVTIPPGSAWRDVSIRRADVPEGNERLVGDLAIAPIGGPWSHA